ncbi:C-glycoside deglycosidase beta subunit domain-containing protein [Neobacillus drentensis]|uniref:C-glycoside deglycosidase beta subunit domain-containing protein n=1 Tax=Neobacillus drentensis TaxID=220684 RepID=UPI002FFE1759
MLEKPCIQSRGFKNVVRDGEIVGFQVNIRSLYYRGLWLSQLRPATVTVNGETFLGEQITWTINGVTYTQAEMAEIGDVHWGLLEPATLTVAKEGGLESGSHEIEVNYTYSCSYFPPVADTVLGGAQKRTLIMV